MKSNRQVKEEIISKIVGKIYRDTIVHQTQEYFITHIYKASQFESMVPKDIFHRVIGFFPNTKYRGKPFILSVVYHKGNDEYEIIVHNPKLKF